MRSTLNIIVTLNMYQLKDMECWASQNADKMCIWYVTGISPEAFIWTHRLDGVEIYQH